MRDGAVNGVGWEGLQLRSKVTPPAGSGNSSILGLLRALRNRIGKDISYGHHQARALSIGLLFAGSGRMSLNTSTLSNVTALLAATFPVFASSPLDNRLHLQALR